MGRREAAAILEEWRQPPIIGDLKDCNNWNGITLFNTIYKILAVIEDMLRDEQAGFRPNRAG